jgi:hypothetical protein
MENIFYIVKTTDDLYKIPDLKIYFTNYGWTVVSFDKKYSDLFVSSKFKYFELSYDDILGFKAFGDMRSEIKVMADDEIEQPYIPLGTESIRVKIPVTEHRYNCILNSMKLFATILLEEEFDDRFNKLKLNFSELEKQTWEQQLQEVKNYENKLETPLLNSISKAKNITTDELVNLIVQKKLEYDQKSSELFVKLIELKTTFKDVNEIENMNLLYAKYFNIQLSFTQEYKESHPEIFNENGGFIVPLGVGYNF